MSHFPRFSGATAVVSAALLGGLGAALCTQAQTPRAQPPYPAAEQSRGNPNRARSADRIIEAETTDVELRCDKLSGLEKSECERRDISNDDAPAGVTSSMQQARMKARAENEAAAATSEAEADSDTARTKPAESTSRMRQAARDRTEREDRDSADEVSQSEAVQNEEANRREQQTDSDSEADTLGPRRR